VEGRGGGGGGGAGFELAGLCPMRLTQGLGLQGPVPGGRQPHYAVWHITWNSVSAPGAPLCCPCPPALQKRRGKGRGASFAGNQVPPGLSLLILSAYMSCLPMGWGDASAILHTQKRPWGEEGCTQGSTRGWLRVHPQESTQNILFANSVSHIQTSKLTPPAAPRLHWRATICPRGTTFSSR